MNMINIYLKFSNQPSDSR